MNDTITSAVKKYYSEKILTHGSIPQGVDWNTKDGQETRFEQLLKICDSNSFFSINDLGCGYGALYEYLTHRKYDIHYVGYDVSEAMLNAASNKFGNAEFILSDKCQKKLDYTIASGIFNVKLTTSNSDWETYLLLILDNMFSMSNKGFAFNALSQYSDPEYRRQDLFYADPLFLFDYCKKKFSKNIALLHDYNLFEFTILVRNAS